MQRLAHINWLLTITLIAACGGSDPAGGGEVDPSTTGGDAPAGGAESTEGGGQEAGGEPAEPAEPAAPEAEPIEATDADAIRAALVAAAGDADALVKIVDPDLGIGAWDREEDSRAHFCDRSRFAQEPNLGYELRDTQEWSCDDELTRCSSVDPETRTGTVFHFHEAGGNGRWLASVIRYHRRVPRYDTEDVQEWVGAAEGVCQLWRTLTGEPQHLDPDKLSVFVSRFNEDVEESSTDFHCGEEAITTARERLAPLMEVGPPTVCRREPLHCTWIEADEHRVYADRESGAVVGIAKLATGLREGPTRLQNREVAAFAQRATARRCQ